MPESILNKTASWLGPGVYQVLQAAGKTVWGILSALVAFEGSPTAGLLMLLWFEAWTAWMVEETNTHWWAKWLGICKERAIVIVCVLAAVVYANTSGQEWIKDILIVTMGGALLFFGWVRLGRRYPVVKLLQGTLARTLQGKGISVDLEDEEGRKAHVSGIIDDARLIDPTLKISSVKTTTTTGRSPHREGSDEYLPGLDEDTFTAPGDIPESR